MKIGIDCRIFSSRFTGIGRYTHELVTRIIKLNNQLKNPHRLVLFFNNPEYQNFKIATKPPWPSGSRPATPTALAKNHIKKVLVNARHYSLAEQIKFLIKLNRENLDIVHFPHFNVPILYLKPFTVTIHDLTLSLFPGQKMTKWYHRLGYHLTIKNAVKKAKKIIAISKHTKKDLQKLLKISTGKIKVIYNGISPDFRPVSAKRHAYVTLKKYKITTPFLLYAGVWRSHKNLPRLIKAFHILRTKYKLNEGSAIKLVITGKPDPHYPEVQKTIQKLHLKNHIITPGLVSERELIHLYNAAAIFVFPSLYEGFGLPPLEAMSCGTPVAAANISSIPEICGKENAVFFDPYNENDIAEKINLLYKDADLQAKLIKNGLRHVAKFSLDKTARETFKIICLNLSKTS